MIYLYGAGGHAKVLIDLINLTGLQIGALIDEKIELHAFCGYTVVRALENTAYQYSQDSVVIAIGDNRIRRDIARKVDVRFTTVEHPSAQVSLTSFIHEGTAIMANVAVNAGAVVGKHCILNTNCSIDHDCKIEDYVHISPNVALAGGVKVGEGTHIGIGASVIQGIEIGQWATIGAGTVVLRNVPDYAVVVGNPGRIVKYNDKI